MFKCCKYPGCSTLVQVTGSSKDSTYCDMHKPVYERTYSSEYHSWYCTARWKRARKRFLSNNPLCVECLKYDELVSATVVDHITPHKGNIKLFWDVSNWSALCFRCHNRKTASEDGGFGNKLKG